MTDEMVLDSEVVDVLVTQFELTLNLLSSVCKFSNFSFHRLID